MATGERLFVRVLVDEGRSRMATVSMASITAFTEEVLDTAFITDTDTACWWPGMSMDSRIIIRISPPRITVPRRTGITLLGRMTHTIPWRSQPTTAHRAT